VLFRSPQGEDLLAAIRPQMRRNRRGPGYSGSTVYLSRAFQHSEADLVAALAAVGLHVPENANEKPVKTTIGGYIYWLNKDGRGGIWINGDEARGHNGQKPETPAPVATESSAATPRETAPPTASPEAEAPAPAAAEPVSVTRAPEPTATPVSKEPVPAVETPAPSEPTSSAAALDDSPLAFVRPLLKPNKRGSGVSGETGYLARALGVDLQVFLTTLTGLGFALPDTEDDKPAFIPYGDEILWLNKNPKDGSVWVNAKASKVPASAKKPTAGAAKPRTKKPAKNA